MTNNNFMDQTNYIKEILEESTESHLADSFEFLPSEMQKAIELMVTEMRARNYQRAVIRRHVIDDVAKGLEGKHHAALHAFQFLHPQVIGTL